MSLTALFLVISAAILHASWNLLAKRAAHLGPAFVWAYGLCGALAYAPWILWILLHDGMTWSLPIVVCILLSGLLHLVYSLALQRGYQVADLSVVYPVARGSAPLASSLAALVLLNETASATGLAGMLCVVAGVLLIASQGRLSALAQPQAWPGVRWGLLIGAFIAAYTVVDAWGVKVLLLMPVVLDWFAGLARTLMLTPHMLQHRNHTWPALRGHWHLAWAVGVLAPLGYILVLYALQGGAPVSLVAPAREMSMMLGTLAGYLLLKEAVGPGRWAGCVAIVTGVVLLGNN